MALHDDILSDLRQILTEHGVKVRWKGIDLTALASRVRSEQQIEIGGLVESPDLDLRVPKSTFAGPLPKFGERIEVEGIAYRIVRVGGHPRSPMMVLSLASVDE